MKLYTEEQLHKAFEDGYLYHAAVGLTRKEQFERQFRDTVYSLTPIELPSDEEIENKSKHWGLASDFFYKGAKWMRDKIQGGNK